MKKKLLIFTAIMITIALMLYIGLAVAKSKKQNAVEDRAKIARDSAVATADRIFTADLDVLRSKNIVDTSIASSKVDTCQLVSIDAGFMIDHYEHQCSVNYVEGFTTKLNQQEVAKILATEQQSTLKTDECVVMSSTKASVRYVQANTETSTYDNNDSCAIPDPYGGAWIDNERTTASDFYSVTPYRTFDPSAIKNDQNIIWVVYAVNRYFNEDVGCGIGLFCNAPYDKPSTD